VADNDSRKPRVARSEVRSVRWAIRDQIAETLRNGFLGGRMKKSALLLVLGCCASFAACAGGSSGPPPVLNPTPAISAISPDSSDQGAPGFTFSVVGSNFISSSSVRWKGSSLPTTFVRSALISANVPASDIAKAETLPQVAALPVP
jgi:hypothetical protein